MRLGPPGKYTKQTINTCFLLRPVTSNNLLDARIMVQTFGYKHNWKKRLDPFRTLPCTAFPDPSPHPYHDETISTFFLGFRRLEENGRIVVEPAEKGDIYIYQILHIFEEQEDNQNGVNGKSPPPYTE
jgi:hypothetical protein